MQIVGVPLSGPFISVYSLLADVVYGGRPRRIDSLLACLAGELGLADALNVNSARLVIDSNGHSFAIETCARDSQSLTTFGMACISAYATDCGHDFN